MSDQCERCFLRGLRTICEDEENVDCDIPRSSYVKTLREELNSYKFNFLQLQKDVLIMALRLYGEDENTFSPETYKVMQKYKKSIENILLNGE